MERTKIEWAVQYETNIHNPRIDGATEATETQVVGDEAVAHQCVEVGAPLSGRNHRVVHRFVTEWERGRPTITQWQEKGEEDGDL